MTEFNPIDRRRFLAGVGVTGVAVSLAALAPTASAAAAPAAGKLPFPPGRACGCS